MDLLALVDRLEELVGTAQKMPIGSRAIVDRRRLLDIVDQMRIAIPQEVRDAQEMVARREEHRRETEEEARLVIARAEDRAARMVEQHELTIAARNRAQEVADEAEQRLQARIEQANADIEQRVAESRRLAQAQMDAADEYAHELLQRLDRQLQAFVRSVQSGIDQLESANAANTGPRVAGSSANPMQTTTADLGSGLPPRPSEPRPEAYREPAPAPRDTRPEAAPAREPMFREEDDRPTPIRRDEPDASEYDERPAPIQGGSENGGGLRNLLSRPSMAIPPRDEGDEHDEEATDEGGDRPAPVIIDDFAMPEFDDRPTRIREEPRE